MDNFLNNIRESQVKIVKVDVVKRKKKKKTLNRNQKEHFLPGDILELQRTKPINSKEILILKQYTHMQMKYFICITIQFYIAVLVGLIFIYLFFSL